MASEIHEQLPLLSRVGRRAEALLPLIKPDVRFSRIRLSESCSSEAIMCAMPL
jgi:uncharacterized sporulation protein YeaH/YhbH (DUF444 family)